MSTEHRQRKPELVGGILKLPFSSHNFSAACFDTLACRVIYNGKYVAKKDGPSPPLTDAVRKNLDGNWGGVDNFPSPAHVAWTSKDGVTHEASIDIGEIFKDQCVLYSEELDVDDVPLDRGEIDPGIVLVVEDRTISVYMKAHISLRHLRIAGNRYSNFRSDLVLAFAQKY